MQIRDDYIDYDNWKEYEQFLKKLSRPERRRILKSHLKRAERADARSCALENSNKRGK